MILPLAIRQRDCGCGVSAQAEIRASGYDCGAEMGYVTRRAIGQMKDRNYPAVLQGYGGEIVMVGIHCDSKTKAHTCEIERI